MPDLMSLKTSVLSSNTNKKHAFCTCLQLEEVEPKMQRQMHLIWSLVLAL